MAYNSVTEYTCSEVFVNFGSKLGEGSFGTVYKGRLHGSNVAVKVINGSNHQSKEEVRRMLRAYGDGHDSILQLLGTVPPDNHYVNNGTCHQQTKHTTWLVMEYMQNGNLLNYLMDYAGQMSADGMIKIAYQVALGMDHLHRNNVIHMDLAARNVLVADDDFNVKIGDFGLCRDYNYSNHYYNTTDGKRCAIRWMPPELYPKRGTLDRQCSRKGDVWSFGVLLFEIWSRGKLPFVDFNDSQVMSHVRNRKTILDVENLCARAWVKDLMLRCFSYNKEDRPNFRQIYTIIENEEYDDSDDESDESDEGSGSYYSDTDEY